MGETRVDLLHLLEDLRAAYPGSLEETILTEIMDAAQSTLTAVDNGSGMQRRELARFHDIAASSKVRGQGIGFAGVGIKLAPLAVEPAHQSQFLLTFLTRWGEAIEKPGSPRRALRD